MEMLKLRRSLIAMLASLVAVAAIPVHAHEGHHDPITKDVAAKRGQLQIDKLVSTGELDASWKTKATLQSAELVQMGAAKQWALVYANPESKKPGTLHVTLSESGRYLAADLKGS
jgi:hypothetical protein